MDEMDNSNDHFTMISVKETYLWKAKLAQEASRFEDMTKFMKQIFELGEPSAREEDNMLAVAYKRVLDVKRLARRTLLAIEQKENIKPWEAELTRQYLDRVDGEQRELCNEMLTVVRGWLLSEQGGSADPATQVFYWKLRGDYGRYAAEAIHDPVERSAVVTESWAAYERAEKLARERLQPVDPVRLGLMLNYSVFLYQVCQKRKRGHDMAKRAYDSAVNEIDRIDDRMYYDSTLILRLIRDNLTIWIQENGGSFDDDNEQHAQIPELPISSVTDIMVTNVLATPSPPGPPPLPNTADADAISSLHRMMDDEDP